ncbi:MAG TPA: hypothetical protein PLB26_19865 [Rubrivivax sp.]|nr:hypothetical protein [Rubrivivax sp.]
MPEYAQHLERWAGAWALSRRRLTRAEPDIACGTGPSAALDPFPAARAGAAAAGPALMPIGARYGRD